MFCPHCSSIQSEPDSDMFPRAVPTIQQAAPLQARAWHSGDLRGPQGLEDAQAAHPHLRRVLGRHRRGTGRAMWLLR